MEARPAQPISILRGHKAQVHSAAFVRNSERLATGDADGFVVVWDLTILRPRAVWRAHTNSILGIAGWDSNKIITYVRPRSLEIACQTRQLLSISTSRIQFHAEHVIVMVETID